MVQQDFGPGIEILCILYQRYSTKKNRKQALKQHSEYFHFWHRIHLDQPVHIHEAEGKRKEPRSYRPFYLNGLKPFPDSLVLVVVILQFFVLVSVLPPYFTIIRIQFQVSLC